jgi:hypothetical protein
MSIYQEVLFLVFFIIGGMIVLDANVGAYILLKLAQAKISIERVYWLIRLHPKNPITNYIQDRKMDKLAKELCEEYQSHTYIPPEDRVDL